MELIIDPPHASHLYYNPSIPSSYLFPCELLRANECREEWRQVVVGRLHLLVLLLVTLFGLDADNVIIRHSKRDVLLL